MVAAHNGGFRQKLLHCPKFRTDNFLAENLQVGHCVI